MELLISKNFNGTALDCYKAENAQDDFWATREQIGRLLGYKKPNDAIRFIHIRNQDRLDKFSTSFKLNGVEGGRTVTRDVIVYNFKGLLEICRYSNRPKANDVMDFLWNIADEIRRTGFYATASSVEKILQDPDAFIKIVVAYKDERNKRLALESKIEKDKPKVIFAEAVDASEDSVLVGTFAKMLNQKGIDIGQNRLFAWFRENGWLMKCRGERWNMPTQISRDKNFFEIKETAINKSNGVIKIKATPVLTGTGQIFFMDGFTSGKFRV